MLKIVVRRGGAIIVSQAYNITLVYSIYFPSSLPDSPICPISLEYNERQRALGYGLKLIERLSSYGDFFRERMKECIARRFSAGLAALKRKKAAKKADAMCEVGHFTVALPYLNFAIVFGDLPSRALMAWLLLEGREGVAKDREKAFRMVCDGTQAGCHHCQGVLAVCLVNGYGCVENEAQSLELARESSQKRSRYGQYALAMLYLSNKVFGLEFFQPYRTAEELFRLAAAQKLDSALLMLGYMADDGHYGISRDRSGALFFFKLAAAQGLPTALFEVAAFLEKCRGSHNQAEAIRFYRRAQAAGYSKTASELWRLRPLGLHPLIMARSSSGFF